MPISWFDNNAPVRISGGNSTGVPLAGGASFIGAGEFSFHADMMVPCKTDAAGILYIEFSIDGGVNYDTSFPFAVSANIGEFHTIVKGARTARVRFVNGSAAQSFLRLQTQYGTFRQGNAPLMSSIRQAADATVVRTSDEEEVMRGKVAGEYIITNSGRNADVDGAEDIWEGGGDYVGFPTAAAENFEVLSSSADDAAAGTGARTVRFYYLNPSYEMFDAAGNFLSFDVTMNGVTGVNSGVAGMRIWRAKVLTSGSGATNAGIITCRWITTTANVFAAIPVGFAQSEVSAFTVPVGYTGYLKRYHVSMNDISANTAQMAIKVRDFGSGTFRIVHPFAITTNKDHVSDLYGADKLDEKTDFIFRVLSVANINAIINASYGIRLIRN